jgi:PST family polysaccharide transporter
MNGDPASGGVQRWTLLARASRRFYGPLARNLAALSWIQVASMVIPLITVPVLARRTGPHAWGILAANISLANVFSIVVEFGFSYGGTRDVAGTDDPLARRRVVTAVVGAKCLLVAVLLLLSPALWAAVPVLRASTSTYAWSVLLAVVQGLSVGWYFQAVHKLPYVAIRDLAARIGGTVLVLMVVQHPSQIAWVPAMQALTLAAALAVETRAMLAQTPLQRVRWSDSVAALRRNTLLFLFRGSVTAYTTGTTFLLGLMAAPTAVANYSNADRLCTAVKSFLVPISQVLFPKNVELARRDQAAAQAFLRKVLLIVTGLGVLVGLTLIVIAGPVVRLLFGPQYHATVAPLMILAATVPLVATNSVLGVQWMLPLGLDRAFLVSIVAAAVLNVGLAIWLVPLYGANGMAFSVVMAETVVVAAMLAYLELSRDARRRVLRLPREQPATAARTNS